MDAAVGSRRCSRAPIYAPRSISLAAGSSERKHSLLVCELRRLSLQGLHLSSSLLRTLFLGVLSLCLRPGLFRRTDSLASCSLCIPMRWSSLHAHLGVYLWFSTLHLVQPYLVNNLWANHRLGQASSSIQSYFLSQPSWFIQPSLSQPSLAQPPWFIQTSLVQPVLVQPSEQRFYRRRGAERPNKRA